MKTNQLKKKLFLNKRTVSDLKDVEMGHLKGGAQTTYGDSCGTCAVRCDTVWSCQFSKCP